jgi:cytosine/adenosine deaminase-related metal-dependent hydrolase
MRKLTADFILGPGGQLYQNYTLVLNRDVIVDLIANSLSDAEYFEGILSPGFINTHCHLELSNLVNKVGNGTGLHGFIRDFVTARKTYTHGVQESILTSDAHMWANGIQAVGDICNSDITFAAKQQSKIRYHNFIELFSPDAGKASEIFLQGKALNEKAKSMLLESSIVPHAPYSVPPVLFELILQHHFSRRSYWSIHNQETESENEMFINDTGKLVYLFNEMGIDRKWFLPTGKNSTESICNFIPLTSNLLFVHNTFSSQQDIDALRMKDIFKNSWFSICAKANLFIEKRIPDIPLFIKNECRITIGTDSLASNDTLSILDELKVLHRAYPEISTAVLLTWATRNGAQYFGWDDLGTFTTGAKPGVIQITSSSQNRIGEKAEVKRLI